MKICCERNCALAAITVVHGIPGRFRIWIGFMNKDNDDASMNRREFLAWVAATAAVAGLSGCGDVAYMERSGPPAPAPAAPTHAYASPPVPEAVAPQYVYAQPQYIPAPAVPAVPVAYEGGKVNAMSRTSWGATAAVPAKLKLMNGVTRITIHHEGSAKPNTDTTPTQVAAKLRLIQKQHRQRLGAGDIGYHFIIDRTGTIWQGRDWKYQGAHASGANSNNVGIMLLGNFEIQQPTAQQLASLMRLTASLMRKYAVPATRIYGHADLCKTQCPGRNLLPHVTAMKRMV